MNKIEIFILKLLLKKQQKKQQSRKCYVSYQKAKQLLLLFEYEETEDLKTIKKIIQDLKKENKKVLAYGFSKSKKEEFEQSESLKIYHKNSFGVFSRPKQSIIDELESQEFDLLIDLSSGNNLFLSYLAIYANALMKVSTRLNIPNLFNFIVNTEQNGELKKEKSVLNKNQFLLDEIFFYLKNIQTKD